MAGQGLWCGIPATLLKQVVCEDVHGLVMVCGGLVMCGGQVVCGDLVVCGLFLPPYQSYQSDQMPYQSDQMPYQCQSDQTDAPGSAPMHAGSSYQPANLITSI